MPFPAPLAALFFLFLSCALAPPVRAAPDVVNYGGRQVNIQPPAGFVDASTLEGDLLRETQARAVPEGQVLKVYLPDAMAQKYGEGRPDAVTRQVTLYGVKDGGNRPPEDKRHLELAARALEGAFAGYKSLPEELRKNAAKNSRALEDALAGAAAAGAPLLLAAVHGDNAVSYGAQVSFATGPDTPPVTAEIATAVVLAGDVVLFVSASSLVDDEAYAAHADWVNGTVEAFTDMLVSANKH